MPRNVSGVYASTAGIPVTSGTTISSTVFNNLITDIGNELTASLPVAGTAPMTGTLRAVLGSASAPGYTFTGDTNTGIYSAGADTLNLATGGTLAMTVSSTQTTTWAGKATGKAFDVDAITSVASATTCDIGAAATSEVLITGTTTITGFGTANAGIRRRGRFAAALTLTHNATSLILPGGVSITTAAGDSFEAVSLGSGNWHVTSYEWTAGTTSQLDRIGSTQGVILYRGASTWAALATGTAGQVLTTNGAGANPSWGVTPGPIPKASAGVGIFATYTGSTGGDFVLPATGTYAYFGFLLQDSTGTIGNHIGGVGAGGATVSSGSGGYTWRGFTWRIA